ncbi:MAG: ROK family protein [Prevotella sp.]|nr:ROK family protein [Prevotella sp.]
MIHNELKTRVVGVNVNVHDTTCAVVDIRGNILGQCSFVTSDYPFVGDYVSVLTEHIIQLAEANGGYEHIRSVGISIPSGNFKTGCIENSPNLPWKGVIPLAAMLRDQLGIAVALANNAHVIALGEQAFGAAHGMRDFVVISLGSGLGSCIYCNGVPHLGANGFAGELGHSCIVPNGRMCGCGKQGCLEAYTAASGVVQTAKELMEESSEPSLMRQVEQLTPAIITGLCEQGDALAIETYRRVGYILGMGLANYASVVNPEAFVFTGRVPKAGHWLLEPACESFEQHVFHNLQGKVKLIPSTIDDEVRNLLGASVLAWEVKEYSLFK